MRLVRHFYRRAALGGLCSGEGSTGVPFGFRNYRQFHGTRDTRRAHGEQSAR
jgi:hypothetical protein